jgi:antitoxin component YwqK of YwqJK toxin-antitoxin module
MESKKVVLKYPSGKIRKIYHFNENGVLFGEYKSFFKSGRVQEIINYDNGQATGITLGFYNIKNKRYNLRTKKKGTPHGVEVYFLKH